MLKKVYVFVQQQWDWRKYYESKVNACRKIEFAKNKIDLVFSLFRHFVIQCTEPLHNAQCTHLYFDAGICVVVE